MVTYGNAITIVIRVEIVEPTFFAAA